MIRKDDFMHALGKDYIKFRNDLKHYCYVNGLKFNEDIFHNTIIKCYNTVNKNNIEFDSIQDVKYYFCRAFKNNLIREKSYCNNKYKEDVSKYDKLIFKDEQITKCDFSIITNKIIDIFGMELYNVFVRNVNGSSIDELQKKYKIKNLKNKLKNIKIFAKKFFE